MVKIKRWLHSAKWTVLDAIIQGLDSSLPEQRNRNDDSGDDDDDEKLINI